MKAFAILLLLAGALVAQELPYDRGSVQMLPGIEQPLRNRLVGVVAASIGEIEKVRTRLREIDARLRANPPAAERQKLQAERGRLVPKVKELFAAMDRKLLAAGLDEAQLARLKRIPRGPLRASLYNRGVLLELGDLSERQRDLLQQVVAAANAASGALWEQRDTINRTLAGKENELMRRRLAGTCDQHVRAVETRFWRIAYYALTPEQMRAARELFSPRYRAIPEVRRQIYFAPGLTPSQANRVNSLFNEYESEAAADRAATQQIRRRLADKKLSREERGELYRLNGAAYQRLGELGKALQEGLRATLTEEQRHAINGLPPVLNVGERGRPPQEILGAMRLTPEQTVRLQQMGQEFRAANQEIARDRQKAYGDMAGAEVGPESPQMMTMQMIGNEARGRSLRLLQQIGHRAFVDVCTPEQVAAWVAAPSVKP